MSTTRTTRLAVSVSEVSLTASLRAPASGRGHDPLSLLFSGAVRAIASDFMGDAWDMPARLEGRAVTVRCVSTPPASGDGERPVIGRCQFCPIARDLDVAVEVDCCPKLFHVLKNTAEFGGGQPGAGITLMLDIMEAGEDERSCGDAVVRLDVTRLSVTASRAIRGSAGPAASGVAAFQPSVASSAVPVL
ncbi:hypothetical protein [Shumkonia mesophila]|uniref:hypothetical protein n=1 Tax=Shumkonia mesophila TaxID=2838854 RepID=UPI002934D254|nr:hypothetical protein [Shumkonia mesophila]